MAENEGSFETVASGFHTDAGHNFTRKQSGSQAVGRDWLWERLGEILLEIYDNEIAQRHSTSQKTMPLPLVAIVGRPNVGKSSIFNWLVGHRLAIVDAVAGVTRDRMFHTLEFGGRYFQIVDTGGIGINDIDDLTEEIEQQIEIAIESASVVLFVVDVRDGMTTLDQEVARRLRNCNKPVLLVCNKADNQALENQATEFFNLKFGEPICISAQQHRHKEKLLNRIFDLLPPMPIEDSDLTEPEMKVAIVGRRNVGKSSFINSLTQSKRMIVSEVAGTTRDSVDVRFELDGKTFVAIDTPGLRRNKSVKTDIDFYSTHRAKRSIRYADVTLMFFDAAEEISLVDRQLCNYIFELNKPCIFVVNKWDLIRDKARTEQWAVYLHENFPSLDYVPIAFISGKSGRNLKRLLNHAQMLFKQSRERISTGALNRIIRRAIQNQSPPTTKSASPRIYYATQIEIQPPTIVLICNKPDAFPESYRRYLLNSLRDHVGFAEVPIRLLFQRRSEADERDDFEMSQMEVAQKRASRIPTRTDSRTKAKAKPRRKR